MIKQIKLRGISRTPSDKTTADGGCAESLNVQIDNDEIAPAAFPKEVEELSPSGEEFIFVHKVEPLDKYLAYKNGVLKAYDKGGGVQTITTLDGQPSVGDVVNIGNTVVLTTSDGEMHYLLYKGGSYAYLGTQVPEVQIDFRVSRKDPEGQLQTILTTMASISTTNDGREHWSSRLAMVELRDWNEILGISPEGQGGEVLAMYSLLQEMNSSLWDGINKKVIQNLDAGCFSMPLLACYAIRLMDGEYINVSAPVYLGAGASKMFDIDAFNETVGDQKKARASVKFNTVYTVLAYLYGPIVESDVWDKWKDYIQSVDIFISPYICIPEFNAKFRGLDDGRDVDGTEYKAIRFEGVDSIKAAIEGLTGFYKVASLSNYDEIKKASQIGINLLEDKSIGRQENLLLRDTLKSAYSPRYIAKRLKAYNSRLIMAGADKVLSRGQCFQFAQSAGPADIGTYGTYSAAFRMNTDDGLEHFVRAHNNQGGTSLGYYQMDGAYSRSYGVVFHPEPTCAEALFFDSSGHYFSLPMSPHPFLNCSFGFVGADVTLLSKMTELWTGPLPTENIRATLNNKIILTEHENVFKADIASALTFSDDVIDAVAATKPLSTGQFGQFPLMVFTKGGVYPVSVLADGSFGAVGNPVTREVALPGTISPIDQAIVFSTAKGVMMLSGGDVAQLSAYMQGRPVSLAPDDLPDFDGEGSKWGRLFSYIINDSGSFLTFITAAKPVYDYKGGRMLFFNPDYRYVYVYVLSSATWHKMERPEEGAVRALNSFPECLVCELGQDNYYHLRDYSAIPTAEQMASEDTPSRAGVIITRSLDLDAPDVRKTIKSIRARGVYNKEDVKYVLYGSMDGHAWARLTSLRGGSYKLFRLLVLTYLAPSERISWVDIDFETRFTNKLR